MDQDPFRLELERVLDEMEREIARDPQKAAAVASGLGGERQRLLRAVETVHRAYFSLSPRLGRETLGALAEFPRAEALMLEMVMAEWFDRGCRGEPVGDLAYEVAQARFNLAYMSGRQDDALRILSEITGGRDWRRVLVALMAKRGQRPEDAKAEVLSIAFELVREIAVNGAHHGKRTSFADQRSGFSQALENAISDYAGLKRKPPRDRVPRDRAVDDAREEGELHPAPPLLDLLRAETPERRLEASLSLRLLIARAGLTDREDEAIQLRRQGLE